WEQGNWYKAGVVPDGNGTFDVVGVTPVPGSQLPGGPEGFIYVPIGSPQFPRPSILVADFSDGSVSAYEVDADGDPVVSSRQAFITGLEGAEGAFIDPVTGDFLFSTFGGGDRVVAVRGFEPPPPNNPPVATDVQVSTFVDQPIAIELGGSDADGDAVTVTSASDPPHGALSGQLPSVTYQPEPGFAGTDSFEFVVDDGNGGTDVGTVTIVVGLVPSQLVAHPAVATLNPFRLTLGLGATLTDASGTPLAGQPVRFVIGGQHLCTGVTDGNGLAVCTSNPGLWLLALLHLGYDAHYDGDATHLPSSSHGPILG
ncbi:MAG: Ig-like domain-containing protein, partial [Acidimicrobiales bacterium]